MHVITMIIKTNIKNKLIPEIFLESFVLSNHQYSSYRTYRSSHDHAQEETTTISLLYPSTLCRSTFVGTSHTISLFPNANVFAVIRRDVTTQQG
jgi:hypothetical protein